MGPKVLVTGASGLLGRAITEQFRLAGWQTLGTAFSRARDGLVAIDLRDEKATKALVEDFKPAVIVHAAAERRPDVCEKDLPGSEVLNVEVSWHLGRAAAAVGAAYIYISTDYLFDGTAAPYKEDAQTRPLNTYGFLKLRGEYAALAAHPSPFILRIPVLYGPTTDLAESAVTTFAVAARNHDKPQTIDDWQIRVPTYTPDIGRTLVIVATTMVDPERKTADKVCGIFNYSASERFTRYQLVQYFGQLQGVSTDHITRDPNPPKGAPRPYDCQLDTSKLSALGLAAPCTPFDVACREILGLPSS